MSPSQRYDPKNKEKTYLQSKYDILLQKVTGKGRNLGNINFVKKVYYESTKGDFLLFPDSQGKYSLYARALGSFRTTNVALITDPETGLPLKTMEQGVLQGIPPDPD